MAKVLDTYNVVVQGVSLINDWRKTATAIVEGADETGSVRYAACDFVIEATSEAELAQRWNETKRDFIRMNVAAYGYTSDPNAKLFDFQLGKDGTTDIIVVVSEVPQEGGTLHSKYCTLDVVARVEDFDLTGQTLPADQREGLVGGVEVVTAEEIGKFKGVSVGATYRSIQEPESIGPLNIVGIVDEGGLARINFGATLPTLPPTPYATVSGTANYNGQHRVVDDGATYIVLDLPFVSVEGTVGTVSIGAIKTAEELFIEHKDALMALAGIDGEEIAVVNVHKHALGDGSVEFVITGAEMDFNPNFDSSASPDEQPVRSTQLMVYRGPPMDNWSSDPDLAALGASSTPPFQAVAEGVIVLSKNDVTGDLIDEWQNNLESGVMTRIADEVSDFVPHTVELTMNHAKPSVTFVISGFGDFNDVLSISRETTKHTPREVMVYNRGDSRHGMQVPNTEPVVTLTRITARVGKDLVNMATSPPTESGYHFQLVDENDQSSSPTKFGDLDGEYYTQTRTEVYLRLKLT